MKVIIGQNLSQHNAFLEEDNEQQLLFDLKAFNLYEV